MAPAVVEQVAQSAAKDFKKESATARLLGSGMVSFLRRCFLNTKRYGLGSAGIAELAIFHPVDTIAKRLMSNQGKVTSAARLNEVIFKDKAHVSVGQKFGSLFPGLGYAAAYKVRRKRNSILKGEIAQQETI